MPTLRPLAALLAALALQACVAPAPLPLAPAAPTRVPAAGAAERFVAVSSRVEPVAEALCRSLTRGPANCDIQIAVDDRPGQDPNAFQTIDRSGRPWIVFTLSLIEMAGSPDELAFVMGHEAAHHVAGHIPRREESARTGAMLAGVLAAATGLSSEEVRQAQGIGASIGAQRYSQEFELEADALGAEIALRAGFDPVAGAAFFDRLPDPGKGFLNTHPANAMRKQVVAGTVRRLSGN